MHFSTFSLFVFLQSAQALRIASVSIKSSPYPIVDSEGNCRDYDPVRTTMWNGTAADARPASITLETSDDKDLLYIDVEGEVPEGTTLMAKLNDSEDQIFAPIKLKAQADGKVQTVQTSMHDDHTVMTYPWSVKGKVKWATDNTKVKVENDYTPVEIYAVSNTLPDYFQKYGIYHDLVSFALPMNVGKKHVSQKIEGGRVVSPWDTASWNRFATEKIHFDSKFQYDTFSGSSWYAHYDVAMFNTQTRGEPTGTFRLRSWLKHRSLIDNSETSPFHVNCYDQASLVQICQSLGPTPMNNLRIAFLQPFGYIKSTSLIGYSDIKTNSPFFDEDKAKAELPAKSAERSYFRNHMFNALGGDADVSSEAAKNKLKIHDACAGPAVGEDNLQGYLNASVDPDNSKSMPVPKQSGVQIGPGIRDFDVYTLNRIDDADDAIEQQNAADFEARLKQMGAGKVIDDEGKVVNIDFSMLPTYLQNKGPKDDYYKIVHSETTMGGAAKGNVAVFDWIYRVQDRTSDEVRIRIMVGKDYKAAMAAMNSTLNQMDNEFEKAMRAAPDENSKIGSWTLISTKESGRGRVMFIEGNVVCDITGMKTSEALHETAEAVHDFISDPPEDAAHPGLPEIGTITAAEDGDGDATKITIKKGQRLSFKVTVKNAYEFDWKIKEGNAFVTYMKQKDGKFDIDIMGMNEGQDTITFSFLNSAGEIKQAKPITVTIVIDTSAPATKAPAKPENSVGSEKPVRKEAAASEATKQGGQKSGFCSATQGQGAQGGSGGCKPMPAYPPRLRFHRRA